MSSFVVLLFVNIWLIGHFYAASSLSSNSNTKPNIIFVFADDWGWNDLDYLRGNTNTQTPFLSDLATKSSLILNSNYVCKVCSPSRAAFFTGRYPATLGLYTKVFSPDLNYAVTRRVSFLANEFHHAGYATHAFGKWHLGFQSWEYTPTFRGFDTFDGFWNGWEDYFGHKTGLYSNTDDYIEAFDLWSNEQPVSNTLYSVHWIREKIIDQLSSYTKNQDTPFFMYIAWQASHSPHQAPDDYIAMYEDAPTRKRMMNQGQTSSLDEAMKKVVSYLQSSGLWENTLLVFSSDNGAEYKHGDNAPLRGFKNTAWEGGLRVPAFVSGGYLNSKQRGQALDTMIHVTDWYPTLLSAANIKMSYTLSTKLTKSSQAIVHHPGFDTDWLLAINDAGLQSDIDGIDMWPVIQGDTEVLDERDVLLDLLDADSCEFGGACGAIRSGKWKFLRGVGIAELSSYTDGYLWYRGFMTNEDNNFFGCEVYDSVDYGKHNSFINSLDCYSAKAGCLFDISEDPCEYNDLSKIYPKVRDKMQKKLVMFLELSIGAIVDTESPMDGDLYNPTKVCANTEFWCPYLEYTDANSFENVVYNEAKDKVIQRISVIVTTIGILLTLLFMVKGLLVMKSRMIANVNVNVNSKRIAKIGASANSEFNPIPLLK